MPMTFNVSLVDWRRFLDALRAGHSIEVLHELFPGEETDLDHSGWQQEFLEQLDDVATRWSSPTVDGLQRLFGTLFWGWVGEECRIIEIDLPPERIPKQIESAWSPPTVAYFARIWRGFRIEDVRPCYRVKPETHPIMETFDEFKEYPESFAGMIVRGAAAGKGLILLVHI